MWGDSDRRDGWVYMGIALLVAALLLIATGCTSTQQAAVGAFVGHTVDTAKANNDTVVETYKAAAGALPHGAVKRLPAAEEEAIDTLIGEGPEKREPSLAEIMTFIAGMNKALRQVMTGVPEPALPAD